MKSKTRRRAPLPLFVKNIYRTLVRHSGDPYFIGRGVAIGCFTAFFIPVSLQLITAFALAVALRADRILALLFTWISNPLTIAFIYPVQCYVGSYLIRRPFNSKAVSGLISSVVQDHSLSSFLKFSGELMASFLAGGLLFGTIAAIIGYHASIRFVTHHRTRKITRQQRQASQRNDRNAPHLETPKSEWNK